MHDLHVQIGKIIGELRIPGCEVILGKDCGGEDGIQLFCRDWPAMATRFLLPDAIVLRSGQLKGIIEIEESDIRPLALSGKVLTSAFTSHSSYRGTAYPIASRAFFIQIIDTSKLSSRSSKLAQCCFLRESIRDTMTRTGWNLQEYEIFHGDVAEFERAEAQQELLGHLRAAILN